ncbi:uncharacterized protein LOC103312302 [Tribolium castaneum]|uniref:uncharacterized protein LOC103312302 n=1 Tax=Tribolium castaneum TaxID=7070 RepID=UPI00046C269B|nr:PREDICTED: uncharacterized protein LOC103312302 isoform X2 [Tribolium castaneum]|eukprot:XP_008190835.1 PREDICTED: uncharacterized protein LOC103312302 isoform X2 [Tribolium castaneum]
MKLLTVFLALALYNGVTAQLNCYNCRGDDCDESENPLEDQETTCDDNQKFCVSGWVPVDDEKVAFRQCFKAEDAETIENICKEQEGVCKACQEDYCNVSVE